MNLLWFYSIFQSRRVETWARVAKYRIIRWKRARDITRGREINKFQQGKHYRLHGHFLLLLLPTARSNCMALQHKPFLYYDYNLLSVGWEIEAKVIVISCLMTTTTVAESNGGGRATETRRLFLFFFPFFPSFVRSLVISFLPVGDFWNISHRL